MAPHRSLGSSARSACRRADCSLARRPSASPAPRPLDPALGGAPTAHGRPRAALPLVVGGGSCQAEPPPFQYPIPGPTPWSAAHSEGLSCRRLAARSRSDCARASPVQPFPRRRRMQRAPRHGQPTLAGAGLRRARTGSAPGPQSRTVSARLAHSLDLLRQHSTCRRSVLSGESWACIRYLGTGLASTLLGVLSTRR